MTQFKKYPELSQVFLAMGKACDGGTPIPDALKLGLSKAKDPELRAGFSAIIDGWEKDNNPLDPMFEHRGVFPDFVFLLTRGGFLAGILDILWTKTGLLLKEVADTRAEDFGKMSSAQQERIFAKALGYLLQAGTVPNFALKALTHDKLLPGWANDLEGAVEMGSDLESVLPKTMDPVLRSLLVSHPGFINLEDELLKWAER